MTEIAIGTCTIGCLLAVVGLFLDGIGAYLLVKGLWITKEKAAELVSGVWASTSLEIALATPQAKDRLAQSRAAKWGFAFLVLGFAVQAVGTVLQTIPGH